MHRNSPRGDILRSHHRPSWWTIKKVLLDSVIHCARSSRYHLGNRDITTEAPRGLSRRQALIANSLNKFENVVFLK